MKTIVAIFILLTIHTNTFAQTDFECKVLEENRTMTKGSANALTINLPNISYEKVNKLWSKYLKNFNEKTQYNQETGEYFSEKTAIKDMSESTVDLISKVYDNGEDGTTVSIWFDLGAAYLSLEQHPEGYPSGEKILKDFSLLFSADLLKAQLKEEKNKLSSMHDALKHIERDIIIHSGSDAVQYEKDTAKFNKHLLNIKEQEKVIETIKRKLKVIQK